MSTVTVESSRFGTLEIAADAIIEFPSGLIGLDSRAGPRRRITDGAFQWLHSIDDPSLALPVTNPWPFFADYEVELSDDDTARVTPPPTRPSGSRSAPAPSRPTSVRTSARRSWSQTAAAIR